MFAVIKTGGKQYLVTPDQKIKIEKIEGDVGKKLVFDQVLLVADDNKVSIGKPIVKGAKVEGEIVRQGREKKKIVFKYHSKTRYRKTKGHRQHFTEVKINSVQV
jgi:large subunit ribosomal protein L21